MASQILKKEASSRVEKTKNDQNVPKSVIWQFMQNSVTYSKYIQTCLITYGRMKDPYSNCNANGNTV